MAKASEERKTNPEIMSNVSMTTFVPMDDLPPSESKGRTYCFHDNGGYCFVRLFADRAELHRTYPLGKQENEPWETVSTRKEYQWLLDIGEPEERAKQLNASPQQVLHTHEHHLTGVWISSDRTDNRKVDYELNLSPSFSSGIVLATKDPLVVLPLGHLEEQFFQRFDLPFALEGIQVDSGGGDVMYTSYILKNGLCSNPMDSESRFIGGKWIQQDIGWFDLRSVKDWNKKQESPYQSLWPAIHEFPHLPKITTSPPTDVTSCRRRLKHTHTKL